MLVIYITLVTYGVGVVSSGLIDSCPSINTLSNDPLRKLIATRYKKGCHRLLKVKGRPITYNTDLDPYIDVPYLRDGEYYMNMTWRVRKGEGKILKVKGRPITYNSDLDPCIDVPYLRDGEYYMNMTWRVRKGEDNRFPKKHVVRLVYSVSERNISDKEECIILRMLNRTARPFQNSIRMTLNCVKLLSHTKSAMVSIQVWQLPGTCKRRTKDGPVCGGMVEHSGKRHYTLALDHYKHQICSCHYATISRPDLNVEVSETRGFINFRITLRNLPSFLKYYTITIEINGEEALSYKIDDSVAIQDDSLMMTTDSIPRKVGTYCLLFYYECMERRRHDISPSSVCHSSDIYNFTIAQVRQPPRTDDPTGTLYILCAILVFALVVVVLVVTFWKHVSRIGQAATNILTVAGHKQPIKVIHQKKTVGGQEQLENESNSLLWSDSGNQPIKVLDHHPDTVPA